MQRISLVLGLLAGCNTIVIPGAAPVIERVTPASGEATFTEGEPISFCVLITDDSPLSQLTLSLTSDLEGDLIPESGLSICERGNAGASLVLTEGKQVLTVSASDPDGNETTLSFTMTPSPNEAPSCTIDAPAPDATVDAGVSLEAMVMDSDHEIDQLTVDVESNVDGLLAEDVPAEVNGDVSVDLIGLTAGAQTLTMTVIDPRGATATCSVSVTVNTAE